MGLTIEQVKRWGVDPAAFCEEALWTTTPDSSRPAPMKLEPHQRTFMREAARRDARGHFVYHTVVSSWPKREGKTKTCAALGAWRAVTRTRQNIGVLANSERQAQSNVFGYLVDYFRESPALRGMVPEADFQTRVLRIPGLNNKVECYPANHRTIQGTAFQALLTDELHAAEDRGKAFTYASNQTEGLDSQVIVSSQAGENVDSNPMWRYHQEAEAAKREGRQSAVLFDYRREPVTPWAVRLARQARRELLPAEYQRLWENAWGALGQKLFRAEDVEAAAMEYEPPRSRGEWVELRRRLRLDGPVVIGVGLDRAGVSAEGDRTVWTVVAATERLNHEDTKLTKTHEDGGVIAGAEDDAAPAMGRLDGVQQIVVLDCETLPTGSEAEVLDAERRTREVYGGADRVTMEAYGCSDLVGKVSGAEVQWPTPQMQQQIFNRAYRLFRERRIIYPAHAGTDPKTRETGLLKAELLNIEYAHGTVALKFGTQSGHDDHAYSLAWAIEAATAGALRSVFVQELGGGDRPTELTAADLHRLQLEEHARILFGGEDDE